MIPDTIEVSDPRPTTSDHHVLGSVCASCGQTSAWRHPRCTRCLGTVTPTRFGPGGSVWSSATVHLQVGHRSPPFTLAYVDLDDGPRVLARLRPDVEVGCGVRVQIVGADDGDVVVSPCPHDAVEATA